VSAYFLVIVFVLFPVFAITLFHRRRMARHIVFVVYTVALLFGNVAIHASLPQVGGKSDLIK
jgi:hypothetical protein